MQSQRHCSPIRQTNRSLAHQHNPPAWRQQRQQQQGPLQQQQQQGLQTKQLGQVPQQCKQRQLQVVLLTRMSQHICSMQVLSSYLTLLLM